MESIKGSFGTRFLQWMWLELSAVTIAANSDCSVATIRSLDIAQIAASRKIKSSSSMTLNKSGQSNAAARITSGDYDATSAWSLSGADGDKLLGAKGDDWKSYGSWHLGQDSSQAVSTKAHYGYPFGKNGKVFVSALDAIRSRASAQNATDIFDAAGKLLDQIKAKAGKSTASKRKDMGDMEMPEPASDEVQADFMDRCVDYMLNCYDEDMTKAEATAHCAIRWDNKDSEAEAAGTVQMGIASSKLKNIGVRLVAAPGRKLDRANSPPPPASGKSETTHVVKAQEGEQAMKKTIAEQISAFESTRVTKSARMDEIMDAAAESGTTLDTAAKEEYDTLESEVKEVDDHIVRLRAREVSVVKTAVEVKGNDQDEAVTSRSNQRVAVQVRHPNVAKGTAFTRYVLALARARGNIMQAEQIAKSNEQWMAETPEVASILKTAVNAGTTSDSAWAGPLVNYQILAAEFVEVLRPLTIIGRIPGLRSVPFKVKIPRQTGAASVNWVGEGRVKPLSSLTFDTITMEFAKIAGIIPLSEELVRLSNPSAEALVQADLAAAITGFMDKAFVDPTLASTDVSPASVTFGVTPTVATGTTAAALRDDVGTLISTFLQNNLQISSGVWVMAQTTALKIGLMRNSLGTQEFPGIGVNGGVFEGLPVVVSENVPYTGGSPTDGGLIILMNAGDIFLADDGQVTIDASREASLQMDSAPDSPPTASTTFVSLWQQNMVAIKAERYIRWAKRRDTAVAFISSAKYQA
jgi:HK97 family phage major capsid protein